MGKKEMEMWVNGGKNEWTSSEQKIVWILSEWVDECPKIADGVNWLVNTMWFILVTMYMVTWYMCTYIRLATWNTMQIILRLQNCP